MSQVENKTLRAVEQFSYTLPTENNVLTEQNFPVISLQMHPRRFQCVVCSRRFARRFHLKRHVFSHHGKKFVNSKMNGKDSQSNFDEKFVKKYQCGVCSKSFPRIYHLSRHIRCVHNLSLNENNAQENLEGNSIKFSANHCQLCRREFRTLSLLQKHIRVIHSNNNPSDPCIRNNVKNCSYKCGLCESTYHNAELLKFHMLKHRKEWRLACKLCGEAFDDVTSKKRHELSHNEYQGYQCQLCDRQFNDRSSLTAHENNHFSSTNKRPRSVLERLSAGEAMTCEKCDRVYVRKAAFLRHMDLHIKENNFLCATCNESFLTAGHLAKHQKLHSGFKAHECHICKMKFARSTVLRRHLLKIHEEEKTYSCVFCNKKFNSLEDRRLHQATHKNLNRHKCMICGKLFFRSGHLTRHIYSRHRAVISDVDELAVLVQLHRADRSAKKKPSQFERYVNA